MNAPSEDLLQKATEAMTIPCADLRDILPCTMLRSLLPLVTLMAPFVLPAQEPYRIPVVVHVIHADGPENISNAQIRDGIAVLTRNFRKQNPDTVDIVEAFRPIAADMGVEFVLARLDPDGNCTSGINRMRSGLTTSGTHDVKNLIHWPRDRYVNIYVTRSAAGLAGHALMPFQADSIPGKDGIVIQGSYFGSTGTSTPLRSVVLSHEFGHFLDLFHIWGGNNVPEFFYLPVGQSANCDIGDEVDDTPVTVGWSNCNLNGTSCDGELDNVQNFMDYAYCARMFTEGQKQRVHAALNSPVAQRNNLWTPANLVATGLEGPPQLCAADLQAARRIVCTDETVQFFDASYHGATGWAWQFGDGQTSTQQDPATAYNTPGTYDITLTVSAGQQSVSVTRPRYVRVLPEVGLPLPYMEGFESASTTADTDLFEECEGVSCFEVVTGTAATGQRALRLPNDAPGLRHVITTPALDMTGTPSPVMRFRYAFARRDTTGTDRMVISISRDCGRNWITRRTITADDLPTAPGTVSDGYTPAEGDWADVLITNIPTVYQTENALLRIEFFTGGGSDLFIDDINIVDVDALSVPDELLAEWRVVPNPATEAFRVESPFAQQAVALYTVDGRLVHHAGIVQSGASVAVDRLPAGTYLVRLSNGAISSMRRLVVIH